MPVSLEVIVFKAVFTGVKFAGLKKLPAFWKGRLFRVWKRL